MMKTFDRMAYVNIIDKTYEKLEGKDVTYENIKDSFENERDFDTLRMFLSIYVKGIFRVYYSKHSEDHIKKVMEIRREFYVHDPEDSEEYEELMNYFESVEDYESCIRLKKNNKEVA